MTPHILEKQLGECQGNVIPLQKKVGSKSVTRYEKQPCLPLGVWGGDT